MDGWLDGWMDGRLEEVDLEFPMRIMEENWKREERETFVRIIRRKIKKKGNSLQRTKCNNFV